MTELQAAGILRTLRNSKTPLTAPECEALDMAIDLLVACHPTTIVVKCLKRDIESLKAQLENKDAKMGFEKEMAIARHRGLLEIAHDHEARLKKLEARTESEE